MPFTIIDKDTQYADPKGRKLLHADVPIALAAGDPSSETDEGVVLLNLLALTDNPIDLGYNWTEKLGLHTMIARFKFGKNAPKLRNPSKPQAVPLLNQHNSNEIRGRMLSKPQISDEGLELCFEMMTDTPELRKYADQVLAGFRPNVSVGISDMKFEQDMEQDLEKQEDEEVKEIEFFITEFSLLECSIVAVPADAFAGVRLSMPTPDLILGIDKLQTSHNNKEVITSTPHRESNMPAPISPDAITPQEMAQKVQDAVKMGFAQELITKLSASTTPKELNDFYNTGLVENSTRLSKELEEKEKLHAIALEKMTKENKAKAEAVDAGTLEGVTAEQRELAGINKLARANKFLVSIMNKKQLDGAELEASQASANTRTKATFTDSVYMPLSVWAGGMLEAGLFPTDSANLAINATNVSSLTQNNLLTNLARDAIFARSPIGVLPVETIVSDTDIDIPIGGDNITVSRVSGNLTTLDQDQTGITTGKFTLGHSLLLAKATISREAAIKGGGLLERFYKNVNGRFAAKIFDDLMNGNGTAPNPRGVINNTAIQSLTGTQIGSNQLTYANIVDMEEMLFSNAHNYGGGMGLGMVGRPKLLSHFKKTSRGTGLNIPIIDLMNGMGNQSMTPAARTTMECMAGSVDLIPVCGTTLIPDDNAVMANWTQVVVGFFNSMSIEIRLDGDVDHGGFDVRCFLGSNSKIVTPKAFIKAAA